MTGPQAELLGKTVAAAQAEMDKDNLLGAAQAMAQKQTNAMGEIVVGTHGDELRHHDLLGERKTTHLFLSSLSALSGLGLHIGAPAAPHLPTF